MTKLFVQAVAETTDFIERAVARIEMRDDAQVELHNLRTYLISLLEITERDPGLDAAADDLHDAAAAFIASDEPSEVRQRRFLHEALIRFRDRLPSLRANDTARRLGLV